MVPHDISYSPQDLTFVARQQDGCTIVTLSGDLDIACAHVLREQLLGIGTQGSRLIADLSGVTFCDASGLSVLAAVRRNTRLFGGALRLAAPSVPVSRILRLTGLGPRFGIFATVQEAISGLAHPCVPGSRGGQRLPAVMSRARPPSRSVRPPRGRTLRQRPGTA